MTRTAALLMAAGLLLTAGGQASAYVGPGAGLSLLGALWGLLLAVGAALLFVILWPVRQLRKRARIRKTRPVLENTDSSGNETSRN